MELHPSGILDLRDDSQVSVKFVDPESKVYINNLEISLVA
jgi:hypothetical protein